MFRSFAVSRFSGYANVALPRAADPPSLQSLAGRTMGTTWALRFDNPSLLPLEFVRSQVETALDRVVSQMSTWEPGSEISRYNQSEPGSVHVLSPEFAAVLDRALHWASESQGAIDPTIGPLVSLWGFGAHARTPASTPTATDIEFARTHVGCQRLVLDRTKRALVQPGGVSLDLSGIAKGFAVDHVATALQAIGLNDFLMEIGGELRSMGRRPGNASWQVQIENSPAPLQIPLREMAIATSGDRWHAHEDGGQRWSHTIDPRSGRAVQHAHSSVSVLHPRCMDADALATVLTVLGPIDGFDFAQRHAVAALFVGSDDARPRIRATDAWAAHTA